MTAPSRLLPGALLRGAMLLLASCCAAFSQSASAGSPGFVKNLAAPPLGVTSSSAILIWDDFVEPDLSQAGASLTMWRYDVYRDGVKVGSTRMRTFTAHGLAPERSYAFAVSCNADSPDLARLETIQVTTKAAGKIFSVRDFGAAGDGKRIDTGALRQAIAACTPGGTVLVPAGTYLIEPLQLKSDMTLELAKGAVLTLVPYEKGKPYPPATSVAPAPPPPPASTAPHPRDKWDTGLVGLISGTDVHNVILTGEGTIDGNGDTWWPHFPKGTNEIDGVRRPVTVHFYRGSDILVQGLTMQDPPFHNNILTGVDNALYSGVKFLKVAEDGGRNGDGLNPRGARNVLIVGCLFGNQDDSIAIKAGPRSSRPMGEYITVRDCVFDGHAAPGSRPLGFAIGSAPRVRHVRVKNCIFIDAASLANIKCNRGQDFTFVEDIRIENIEYINHSWEEARWNRGPLSIDQYYYAKEGDDPSVAEPLTVATPLFRDIHFRNIRITNAKGWGVYLKGLAEAPIRGVSLENVTVRSRDGMIVENVEDLNTRGLKVLPFAEQ